MCWLFEHRCDVSYSLYRDFDEGLQCAIVERYMAANLSTVRSKTAYFIGILKQARTGKIVGE
jgi:hypothetical protein